MESVCRLPREEDKLNSQLQMLARKSGAKDTSLVSTGLAIVFWPRTLDLDTSNPKTIHGIMTREPAVTLQSPNESVPIVHIPYFPPDLGRCDGPWDLREIESRPNSDERSAITDNVGDRIKYHRELFYARDFVDAEADENPIPGIGLPHQVFAVSLAEAVRRNYLFPLPEGVKPEIVNSPLWWKYEPVEQVVGPGDRVRRHVANNRLLKPGYVNPLLMYPQKEKEFDRIYTDHPVEEESLEDGEIDWTGYRISMQFGEGPVPMDVEAYARYHSPWAEFKRNAFRQIDRFRR